MSRHGKFIDIDCGGTHLVFHLARAGWLRWSDAMPATVLRPGKSPIALRVRFDDGSGFDLTEAGTKKRLAAYVVNDPATVPGIASLGPDPMADAFTLEVFAAIAASHRMQVKGMLRDQSIIAGVGNAYSDEVLHVAKLSPFAIAAKLGDAEVERLYTALRGTLAGGGGRGLRQARQGAQGRQAGRHAGARAHRRDLPRVRRRRARGVVRRLLAAVLRHLPDRRQAARRPAHEQVPQVAASPNFLARSRNLHLRTPTVPVPR